MAEHHEITDTDFGTGQKTLKSYIIGYTLSLLLTLIPFALVGKRLLSDKYLYISITVLALIQLYVQVVFFLRLNASPKGKWNFVSFMFTILIIVVVVFGSLWIMYNLNNNMM